jgi:hypothetical protein
MKLLLFLTTIVNSMTLVNSYVLNIPVNIYKRNYDSNIVKVYEPELIDKSSMNALVFYTGANSLIPADIYSNFIKALNNYNFSVSVVTNNNDATTDFLYDIRDEYKELIPLTHSSGYVSAIKTINKQKNIKKAVFLDPVDNSGLLEFNLFNVFNEKQTINHLKSILVLNAEKSYKGSIFPKFEIPFIPAFAVNTDNLEKSNPDVEIEKINAEEYGHSDVLDSLWSDLMHGLSISKGNEVREQSVMDEYVDWLAQQIYEFVNNMDNDVDNNVDNNVDNDENTISSNEITKINNLKIVNLNDEDRYVN